MSEYTASTGKTVRVGQFYRDSRKSNVRTLRVDAVGLPWQDWRGVEYCQVGYTVIRQEYEGVVTEPMRTDSMDAARLTGRLFVRVDADASEVRS